MLLVRRQVQQLKIRASRRQKRSVFPTLVLQFDQIRVCLHGKKVPLGGGTACLIPWRKKKFRSKICSDFFAQNPQNPGLFVQDNHHWLCLLCNEQTDFGVPLEWNI